jgi:hypothetical protein
MGLYNSLAAIVGCRFCQQEYEDRIQFQYGLLWQLEYVLGQGLQWDCAHERANVGAPNTRHVVVYGISEANACPQCGRVYQPSESPEYDIHVVENIIRSVGPMESYQLYRQEEGGRFYLLPT